MADPIAALRAGLHDRYVTRGSALYEMLAGEPQGAFVGGARSTFRLDRDGR